LIDRWIFIFVNRAATWNSLVYNLLKEILAKLQKEQPWIELEFIELDNLKQVGMVPGLEVEKLPALLINNEQVTAGSLPSKKQIITWIASEGGNNVEYNK